MYNKIGNYQLLSQGIKQGSPYKYGGFGRADGTFKGYMQSSLRAPESMESMFEDASRAYQVPMDLLKAVAKAESNFNPAAVSPKGAVGVMQLMPATARGLGVDDPYDARSNIFGGAKYLRENLDRYDGNIELTLAAYNAGCNNVSKYGGIPPFKETQNYVKKVVGYMEEGVGTAALNQYPVWTDPGAEYSEYSGVPRIEKEQALYFMELMRVKMQMQLFSGEDGADHGMQVMF